MTTAAMTADEERAIREWLASTGEIDPEVIADVMRGCRVDSRRRADHLWLAGSTGPVTTSATVLEAPVCALKTDGEAMDELGMVDLDASTHATRYDRHPLSAAWPDMSEDDFTALVESIKAGGLRHPITLFEGKVLDGWHRQMACEEAGQVPSYRDFDGDTEQAYAFVEAEHTRRNLTPGQRVAAVLAMVEYRAGAGRPNNSATVAELTAAEIAKRAGTSTRTVERVKEVADAAPEQLERVRRGEAPSKVLREASRDLTPKPMSRTPEGDETARIANLEAENAALRAELAEIKEQFKDANDDAVRFGAEAQAARAVIDGEAAQKILQLEQQAVALRRTADDWQNQCGELRKQVRFLERKIDRLKAA